MKEDSDIEKVTDILILMNEEELEEVKSYIKFIRRERECQYIKQPKKRKTAVNGTSSFVPQ